MNKNKNFLKILIRSICLAVILYLTGCIAKFLPDIKLIRITLAIIALIIAAISLYIIGSFEKNRKDKIKS